MQITTLWRVIIRAAQDWWEDNCLRLAASLAYYTALSLAPLVLLIVGIVGLVLDRQQVASQLEAEIEGLMGPAGRELVNSAEFTQAWATRHGGVAPQPHAVAGAAPQTKGEAAAERTSRS
jgi:uncharacterized BrkB/YihY/UPF0761 family membrane protein